MGSLTEVRNQIYIARDVGYLHSDNLLDSLLMEMIEVQKMLYGLIKVQKLKSNV